MSVILIFVVETNEIHCNYSLKNYEPLQKIKTEEKDVKPNHLVITESQMSNETGEYALLLMVLYGYCCGFCLPSLIFVKSC